VDVVATSEVSVSLTLDPKAHLGDEAKRFLSPKGLKRLEDIARVDVRDGRAIVSFIADVARSTELIARVFTVLAQRGVKVEMLSQGASKVNISLVVLDADAEEALRIIHDEFFSTSKEAVASR
jgi:aspartate kinase